MTLALYGASASSSALISCEAATASTSGGRRSDSLKAVRGRSTLPALDSGGRPSAPVTDSVGRQVRFSRACSGSVVMGSTKPPSAPQLQGKRRQTSSPRMRAVACTCSTRSAGISQCRLCGSRRPVELSSRRSSRWRRMRNDDGTTPLESPECTPSSSTCTSSVPETMPRSEVVIQSWS